MKVDRKKVRVSQTTKHTDEVAQLKKAEALSFIWDLTEENYSLSGRLMLNPDYKEMLSLLLDNEAP